MELSDNEEAGEANTEKDFHFVVSNMNDEDDMVELSSDEGESEEFIKDYKISVEDDVGCWKWKFRIGGIKDVLCTG